MSGITKSRSKPRSNDEERSDDPYKKDTQKREDTEGTEETQKTLPYNDSVNIDEEADPEEGSDNHRELLGSGTYGHVYNDGYNAVKVFKDGTAYMKELLSYRILRNNPDIIQLKSWNMNELSITITKGDDNLLHWYKMRKFVNMTNLEKLNLVKGFLRATVLIHGLNVDKDGKSIINHTDISLANILIKDNQTLLCDLGLVSKCENAHSYMTSPGYREIETHNDKYHDIFSIGVVLMCVFGKYKRKKFPDRDYISKFLGTVTEENVAIVINRCTFNNRNNRPTSLEIYQFLYKETPIIPQFTNQPLKFEDYYNDMILYHCILLLIGVWNNTNDYTVGKICLIYNVDRETVISKLNYVLTNDVLIDSIATHIRV